MKPIHEYVFCINSYQVTMHVQCHITERSEVNWTRCRVSVCTHNLKASSVPAPAGWIDCCKIDKTGEADVWRFSAQSLGALDPTRAFRLRQYKPWLIMQLILESSLPAIPGSKLIRVLLLINSSSGDSSFYIGLHLHACNLRVAFSSSFFPSPL